MIKINKYEAIGFGISIAAMALALFLMRLDGSISSSDTSNNTSNKQSASVIVAENGVEGVGEALNQAISANKVQKVVVTDVLLGYGEEVKSGDTIEVQYIGTLQNGQEFDNSYKKENSFVFEVGSSKVIDGWNEGVVGMKTGGQRILIIPAHLAYGSKGYGPIPPNATVVYAIELVSIK